MNRLIKFFKLMFLILFFLSMGHQLSAQRGMKKIQIKDSSGKQVLMYDESHALVIGVSNYTAGWSSLPCVKHDVIEVKKVLEKHRFNVVTVMDPNKSQLDRAFEDFIYRYGSNPNNRLLFYFAGHGKTIGKTWGEMGYIVPSDAPNPNYYKADFQRKAMAMKEIEILAEKIESKHALFIFDACFSGSIFSSRGEVPGVINYKTANPVRQFITSGSADETVPDKSIFKEQFIRALNGEADSDRDGYLTGTELGLFLQTTVINYSHENQHPQYGKIRNPDLDKGDFVFAIKNILPVTPKKLTSHPIITTPEVREIGRGNFYFKSEPDGAIVFIDDKKIDGKTTPFTHEDIESGNYQVRFEKEEYVALENVILNPGEFKTISAILKKAKAGLKIISNPPEALILLDGVQKGLTPKILSEIKAGKHKLKITRDKFVDYDKEIYLEPNKINRVEVNLEKYAYLDISTNIDGANLYVDEQLIGQTPLTVKMIPGDYSIKISENRYFDFTCKKTYKGGEQDEIHANLTKPAALEITTEPSYASIYLNDKYKGISPLNIGKLMPGGYNIGIRNAGYLKLNKYYMLKEGENKILNFKLDRGKYDYDLLTVNLKDKKTELTELPKITYWGKHDGDYEMFYSVFPLNPIIGNGICGIAYLFVLTEDNSSFYKTITRIQLMTTILGGIVSFNEDKLEPFVYSWGFNIVIGISASIVACIHDKNIDERQDRLKKEIREIENQLKDYSYNKEGIGEKLVDHFKRLNLGYDPERKSLEFSYTINW